MFKLCVELIIWYYGVSLIHRNFCTSHWTIDFQTIGTVQILPIILLKKKWFWFTCIFICFLQPYLWALQPKICLNTKMWRIEDGGAMEWYIISVVWHENKHSSKCGTPRKAVMSPMYLTHYLCLYSYQSTSDFAMILKNLISAQYVLIVAKCCKWGCACGKCCIHKYTYM